MNKTKIDNQTIASHSSRFEDKNIIFSQETALLQTLGVTRQAVLSDGKSGNLRSKHT